MSDDKKEICPVDALHTERERERIVRREQIDVDWDDPMTQAYGHPEWNR